MIFCFQKLKRKEKHFLNNMELMKFILDNGHLDKSMDLESYGEVIFGIPDNLPKESIMGTELSRK